MGRGVAQHVERVDVFVRAGHDRDLDAVGERRGQVTQCSVHTRRDRRLREARADRGREVARGTARRQGFGRAVG